VVGVLVGGSRGGARSTGVADEDGGDASGVGGDDVSSWLVADHEGALGWNIEGFEGGVDDGGVGLEPADVACGEHRVEVGGETVVAELLGDLVRAVRAIGRGRETGAGGAQRLDGFGNAFEEAGAENRWIGAEFVEDLPGLLRRGSDAVSGEGCGNVLNAVGVTVPVDFVGGFVRDAEATDDREVERVVGDRRVLAPAGDDTLKAGSDDAGDLLRGWGCRRSARGCRRGRRGRRRS